MIELKNITFEQYIRLEDRSEYDFAMKYGYPFLKPEDVCSIGDFTQLEFGLIKDLQQDISQGLTWEKMLSYMVLLSGKDEIYFYSISLIRITRFRNYIVDEIRRIVEIENKILAYNPTEEEVRAGIDKLSVFGVYSQLRQLATTFHQPIEWARKLKYEDAFVELCYQKMSNDFERALIEIRKPVE